MIDHMLPRDLDDIYGPGAENADDGIDVEHPLSTKEGRDAFVDRIVTSEIETLALCFPRTASVALQEWTGVRKLSVDTLRRMKAAQRHARKHFSKLLTSRGK